MTPAENFLEKIHEYGARINAPEVRLPGLMQPPHEGLWIEVDRPALIYRLMYTERGTVDSVIASADPLEVLEQIFQTVTFDMASEQTNHLLDFTLEGAFKARKEHDKVQENLMGLLHPEWQARQIERNAEFWKRWNDKA